MGERKLDVIQAAIRLFSENGYNSTSVEEIAKESGMAKGSFYKLFHSKEDLLFEIFLQIPKRIKTELAKIYSRNYDFRQEKLTDFISISLESIFSYHLPNLMSMLHELPLSKNKEQMQQIELEINMLLKEFYLDTYGEELENYIWDLIALQKGLFIEYVHLSRYQEAELDCESLAVFIADVIDIMAEGLMERKPKPVLDIDRVWGMCAPQDSPLLRGQKIQFLLKRMTRMVKELKLDAEEKEEYLNTIVLLEEECTQREPKTFLLKALMHYLRSIPELERECAELIGLLDAERD